MAKFISISSSTELLRIPSDRLMFITADGNYSALFTQDGRTEIVCLQLGVIEDLISSQLGDDGRQFFRIGRSLIVNASFICKIDLSKQEIIVSDCRGNYHTLQASKQALAGVKYVLEEGSL